MAKTGVAAIRAAESSRDTSLVCCRAAMKRAWPWRGRPPVRQAAFTRGQPTRHGALLSAGVPAECWTRGDKAHLRQRGQRSRFPR